MATLIDAARADVEALADRSRDDVLKLLVKQSKALPGTTTWVVIAEALVHFVPSMAQERRNQQRLDRYVRERYESLQSNQTPLAEVEKRMICALQLELGNQWTEIARRLGNGRTEMKVKNYWYSHGHKMKWVGCDKCDKWRLIPKSIKVDEKKDWLCAQGRRKCADPCDWVLPEEATVEAPADAAAVVGTPMAPGNDDALQQPPPPDVVELNTAPPRAPEDEDALMTEASAADAVPESVAAVDGGSSAPLVQQPAAPAAAPPADPAAELEASFAELKLKLTVDDASDFEDAVAALIAKVRAARAAATNSMDI